LEVRPSGRKSGQMLAIAVRDDGLSLFLRVRRSANGDVYILFPRSNRPDWDPHTSYHASGQLHQKSYGHEHLVRQRPAPDIQFKATQNVVTTPISMEDVRAIATPCHKNEYSCVIEIAVEDVPTEQGYVSVDLCEAGLPPIIPPGARIRRQWRLEEYTPSIVVSVYECPGGSVR